MQTKTAQSGTSPAEADFAFSLLRKVTAEQGRGNVFLSPFSASQAVLLAANGTQGPAQAAFLKAVGLPAGNVSTLNRREKVRLSRLQSSKGNQAYRWTAANAIWSRYAPNSAYVETCAANLGATAAPLTTAAAINRWVSQNTAGRITNLVSPDAVRQADLILTNAVYFKGRWVDPFAPYATRSRAFHLPDGSTRQQMFLHKASHDMLWYKGGNYEAVTLPYQGGASLIVLLPARGMSAAKLLVSLSAREWNRMRDAVKPSYVGLVLPKFEATTSASLLKPLTALGMPRTGNFSPISDKLAVSKINDVIQKTFVRVDEEGTEAAAATSMAATGAGAPSADDPHPFVVDRPFLCAIVHDATGTILFSGVINNPKPPQK